MNNNDNQPVTRKQLTDTLGEFAENVLLPAVSSMMDEKITNLVTKDYLDEKLSDLAGDLTVLMRKEDRKLGALISF